MYFYYASNSTIIVNAFKKQVFKNQNYIDTKSIILGYFFNENSVYSVCMYVFILLKLILLFYSGNERIFVFP